MKKIFNLLFYYFLILLSLFATSWIIYSRFFRERTIRDIPDSLLTELRFWILIYVCCIYLYVIKSLLTKKESNIVLKNFINLLYKPMILLDHSIKYNRLIKPFFVRFMIFIISVLYKTPINLLHTIIFMMQIFPRFILITFLLIDTFYFQKIETFYTVILIGLLPFVLRYIKYALRDFYEYIIIELESKYSYLLVYEKGFEFWTEDLTTQSKTSIKDVWSKLSPTAPYHNTKKTIREFIEIDFESRHMAKYSYEADPSCKLEVIEQYVKEKFKGKKMPPFRRHQVELLVFSDLVNLKSFFNDTMPALLEANVLFFKWEYITEHKTIRWSRIIIFFLYFLCWFYILILSYWYFPVELLMAKYYIKNFLMYITVFDNPFAELYWGSLNINLMTLESIALILKVIIKKIIEILL